ncbi:unnamed protein product [Amoebophrya sp. A25]|nr:unnamed protein product [Amoebophrya sp. A25]|eukprot:GSA25T00004543001.1
MTKHKNRAMSPRGNGKAPTSAEMPVANGGGHAKREDVDVDDKLQQASALSAQRLTRLRGLDVLRDPFLNKGTAFTERERDMLGLRGLLPPVHHTIEEQMVIEYKMFNECASNIEKYNFLDSLHNRNETLYYRFLLEYVKESMPIVYTPTVGQACIEFSQHYFQGRARGLYLCKNDKEHFREICRNWPQHDVQIIVITDGSRILGLGDLGINGMGIPIGKLALYAAAAGFLPWSTLPITVDCGTNTEKYMNDPHYIGIKEKRPEDPEFYGIMEKAIEAIKWRWPRALIQFEDFSNEHAFGLLDDWKDKILCFNDDIQGTAATVLAGLLGALRIQQAGGAERKMTLREQRIVFLGAGSAGVGVADLIAEGMYLEGVAAGEGWKTVDEYRKNNFWLVDSKGTVTTTRGDKLQAHKIPFARSDASIPTLGEAVKQAKPTILIGLAGIAGGSFTQEIVQTMDKDCTSAGLRPIIMALSNPTTKAECTAEEAYKWTEGRAVYASGSPFEPVTLDDGRTIHTGQGNNMYIFPGVGYGAVQCNACTVTNSMFYQAAKALSDEVTVEDLQKGSVYPELSKIRSITANVARAVCDVATKEGLAGRKEPKEGWLKFLTQNMWWPRYDDFI